MGIILASQSPRRKELLELAGIEHRVIVSQVDEILDEDLDVAGQVQDLAIQKACAVAELFPQETIIGADTIVVFGGKILGKPKNEEDAFNMLKSLSGRKHQVMTGVSIINKDKELLTSFVNITEVEFYNVTDEFQGCLWEIDCKRGRPYIWRKEDYEYLSHSNRLFARKFDENVDEEIINMLINKIKYESNS